MLFDLQTGKALALLEGMYLTGMRTGAVSALAAYYLSNEEAETVGIIGADFQSYFQAWEVSTVRSLVRVYVFDKDETAEQDFKNKVEENLGLNAVLVDAERDILNSDIIITAASSKVPVFSGNNLKKGTTIIAIGSFNPDSREVDTETIKESKIFVDSYQATLSEAGDLLNPSQISFKYKTKSVDKALHPVDI